MKGIFKEVTTWVGLVGIIILMALVVAVVVGKIDAATFATVTGSTTAFLGGVLLWARDRKNAEK